MEESPFGEVDDDDGPGVWIIEERPPLQEGKFFVDYGERATIAEHLEGRLCGVEPGVSWDLG